MKITIESTDKMTTWEGVPCRIWRGMTEGGVACDLAIPLIRVRSEADNEQFENELRELRVPAVEVDMRTNW